MDPARQAGAIDHVAATELVAAQLARATAATNRAVADAEQGDRFGRADPLAR
jgi:hypothetical protein